MRQRRYKIREVIKVRQILLVQVVKEERGNKGAALTTYLEPAGPLLRADAEHGARRRDQPQDHQRRRSQKLKEISSSITVPEDAWAHHPHGGPNRTKTEIKRDYEYLLRQWEMIRDLTLKSIAPAPIYEEGSLIKRAIRDLQPGDRRNPGRWRARLSRGQPLHEDAHAFAGEEREALPTRHCRCSRAFRSRAISTRCSTRSFSWKSAGISLST